CVWAWLGIQLLRHLPQQRFCFGFGWGGLFDAASLARFVCEGHARNPLAIPPVFEHVSGLRFRQFLISLSRYTFGTLKSGDLIGVDGASVRMAGLQQRGRSQSGGARSSAVASEF